MTRTTRCLSTGLSLIALAALAACSGEKPAATGQPAPGGAAPAAAAAKTPPPPTAAWEALTHAKFRDEEFAAAIATLEPTNGATDAAADVAGGVQRLLGIRQATGWYKLPGVGLPREKLENVTIAKIDGIVDGSENPHHVRYQMLAERYAKEYNGVMMRVIH